MSNSSWIDDLLDLLCKIYQSLGGDCSDFEGDPHKAVGLVTAKYAADGAPKFKTPADLATFLGWLDDLEAHLGLPANTLTSADTAALTLLIADLRKDLA